MGLKKRPITILKAIIERRSYLIALIGIWVISGQAAYVFLNYSASPKLGYWQNIILELIVALCFSLLLLRKKAKGNLGAKVDFNNCEQAAQANNTVDPLNAPKYFTSTFIRVMLFLGLAYLGFLTEEGYISLWNISKSVLYGFLITVCLAFGEMLIKQKWWKVHQ